MTRVGIIETGRPPEKLVTRHGDFYRMFCDYFAESTDLEFSRFAVAAGDPVPEPSVCGAWIITGSPAGVYEDHAWIPPTKAFARKAIENSVSVLGICFGHQLMAEAMGGKVEKSDKGRGIGIHHYKLTQAGKILVPGFDALHLAATHQDQVVKPPPGAELLASSPFCSYAAFAYGDAGLSFQPHPEFTVTIARDESAEWQKKSPAPDNVYIEALKTFDTIPSDAQRIMPMLRNFLNRSAHP